MMPGGGQVALLFKSVTDIQICMAFCLLQVFFRNHVLPVQVFKGLNEAAQVFNRNQRASVRIMYAAP